jgi:hypothetical protein
MPKDIRQNKKGEYYEMFIILFLHLLSVAITSTSFVTVIEKVISYFVAFFKDVDVSLIKTYGGEFKRQYQLMPIVSAKLPEK